MPLAAVVARSEITERADAYVASTYSGHPAACAAAVKTIEILYRDRLFERANELGARGLERLSAMKEKYAVIGDVRGKGLWLAAEFVTDRKTREKGFHAAAEVNRACLRMASTYPRSIPGSYGSSRRSPSSGVVDRSGHPE